VYRYSTIEGFSVNGGHVDAAFLFCNLCELDVYGCIFNLCVFVDCTFENCTFRGTAFPGCKFVDCTFTGCQFIQDNLGGECSFDDTRWYGCTQSACEGLDGHVPRAV